MILDIEIIPDELLHYIPQADSHAFFLELEIDGSEVFPKLHANHWSGNADILRINLLILNKISNN